MPTISVPHIRNPGFKSSKFIYNVQHIKILFRLNFEQYQNKDLISYFKKDNL
jgi:hypothetical protein